VKNESVEISEQTKAFSGQSQELKQKSLIVLLKSVEVGSFLVMLHSGDRQSLSAILISVIFSSKVPIISS